MDPKNGYLCAKHEQGTHEGGVSSLQKRSVGNILDERMRINRK